MKAYLCKLTEINGEYEYGSQFIIWAEDADDHEVIDEIARYTTAEWRDSAEWEDDFDLAWNPDGCTAVKYHGYNEIPLEEARVLQKYLFSVDTPSLR